MQKCQSEDTCERLQNSLSQLKRVNLKLKSNIEDAERDKQSIMKKLVQQMLGQEQEIK